MCRHVALKERVQVFLSHGISWLRCAPPSSLLLCSRMTEKAASPAPPLPHHTQVQACTINFTTTGMGPAHAQSVSGFNSIETFLSCFSGGTRRCGLLSVGGHLPVPNSDKEQQCHSMPL